MQNSINLRMTYNNKQSDTRAPSRKLMPVNHYRRTCTIANANAICARKRIVLSTKKMNIKQARARARVNLFPKLFLLIDRTLAIRSASS